jgi:hypothetical protein
MNLKFALKLNSKFRFKRIKHKRKQKKIKTKEKGIIPRLGQNLASGPIQSLRARPRADDGANKWARPARPSRARRLDSFRYTDWWGRLTSICVVVIFFSVNAARRGRTSSPRPAQGSLGPLGVDHINVSARCRDHSSPHLAASAPPLGS